MSGEPFQRDFGHGFVCYTTRETPTVCFPQPRLFVQSYDQYGHYRELVLHLETHDWRVGLRTPWSQQFSRTSARQAEAFVARFIDRVRQFPDSLFNSGSAARPRHAGFLYLAETLRTCGGLNLLVTKVLHDF